MMHALPVPEPSRAPTRPNGPARPDVTSSGDRDFSEVLAGARSSIGRGDVAAGDPAGRGPARPTDDVGANADTGADARESIARRELAPVVGVLAGSRTAQTVMPLIEGSVPTVEPAQGDEATLPDESPATAFGDRARTAERTGGGLAALPSEPGSVDQVVSAPRRTASAHAEVSSPEAANASHSAASDPSQQVPGLDVSLEEVLREAVLRRSGSGHMPHPSDPVPMTGGPGDPDRAAHPFERAVVDAVHALDPGTHGTTVATEIAATVGAPSNIRGESGSGRAVVPPHGAGAETVQSGADRHATDIAVEPPIVAEEAGSLAEVSPAARGRSTAAPAIGQPSTSDSAHEVSQVETDALVGDALEGDRPEPGSLSSGVRLADGASAPRRVAALAARIEQWIDRVRSAPPPNVMTVRPEGQDGYAIRVAFESGSLYVSVDGAQPDDVAWVRQALDQLTRRGLDLGGFEMSQSGDHQRDQDEAAAPIREGQTLGGAGPLRARADDGLRL